MADLADRPVDELSGGQRQRAWISMALAQGTDLLLLDEPTTYLDLAHQIDVLDLVGRLHAERGRTVVIVLHDLNLAARYAQRLVAMKDGALVAVGTPAEVLTEDLLADVFDLEARVLPDPVAGTPMVVPRPPPPLELDSAAGVSGREVGTGVARAVCASTIPVRTTTPPATCQPVSTCSSHSQATIEANTGSTVATRPAAVGGRCRSAAIDSQNGTIAPRTTIQATSTHSGSSSEPSDTGTRSASTAGVERPPRRRHGPEHRGRHEAPAGQRHRVAGDRAALAQQVVGGQAERRDQRRARRPAGPASRRPATPRRPARSPDSDSSSASHSRLRTFSRRTSQT